MTTDSLPLSLYSAEQVRALDAIAIEQHGISGFTLMTRAAQAVLNQIQRRWPAPARLGIICGAGNNGGDGYVLATLAGQAGYEVMVIQAASASRLQGDAARACQQWQSTSQPQDSCVIGEEDLSQFDLIIDALLGTGLLRDVSGGWAELIGRINAAAKPVVAIDIPSGVNADTGAVMGTAVHAQLTVTFIGLKRGLFTAQGPDMSGEVVFDDLQVPAEIYKEIKADCHALDLDSLQARLPKRWPCFHKGNAGHVLIIGGEHGMLGAVAMAGEAALRSGAGLVSIVSRPRHADALVASCPELMVHGLDQPDGLTPLLERIDVIAIGPGLGQSDWAAGMLGRVLESRLPCVVDADALNLLAFQPEARSDWVITPHPGEAARLLSTRTEYIQQDRFRAVERLARQYEAFVLLKGCGSLVMNPGERSPGLVRAGNPGMASAGMGDILTGLLAALIAQGMSLADATRLAALVHAMAGDRAANAGQRGLLATDLIAHIRQLLNPGDDT